MSEIEDKVLSVMLFIDEEKEKFTNWLVQSDASYSLYKVKNQMKIQVNQYLLEEI